MFTTLPTVRSSARSPSTNTIQLTTFTPPAPIIGGVGPSPLTGAGAPLAASELTENTTADPEQATPTALGGGNRISNLAQSTGLEVQ